jgi:hypothetical protein
MKINKFTNLYGSKLFICANPISESFIWLKDCDTEPGVPDMFSSNENDSIANIIISEISQIMKSLQTNHTYLSNIFHFRDETLMLLTYFQSQY